MNSSASSAPSIRVGGFTPFTTIDFPGELAAVVYLQGCPWRCRYCHNGGLLDAGEPPAYAWSEVLVRLQRRRGLLDAVVFSGGEPTAQAGLAEAMRQVASMGFRVGLHTAGCYPQRLSRILPLLDWVGLDIKALPEDYPGLTGVADSGERAFECLQLVLDSGVRHEVRVTVHGQLQSTSRLRGLLDLLDDYGLAEPILQRCRDGEMLDPSLGTNRLHWPDEARCTPEQWRRVQSENHLGTAPFSSKSIPVVRS